MKHVKRYKALDHDKLMGGLMNVAFRNDDEPLVQVGYLRNAEDGSLYCENVLQHDPSDVDESNMCISDPTTLTYTLTLHDESDSTEARYRMQHRIVNVGLGSNISKLTAHVPVHMLPTIGKTARASIDVHNNDRFLRSVFSGSYIVPSRQHKLGHPRGPLGYMVQVFPKNMLFVQPTGKVTMIINMLELDD